MVDKTNAMNSTRTHTGLKEVIEKEVGILDSKTILGFRGVSGEEEGKRTRKWWIRHAINSTRTHTRLKKQEDSY